MKTSSQKLKRIIFAFCIGICTCMPLIVFAQEHQSQITDKNHDVRRSPSRRIITMSYDEQTDTYLLHFNIAMENVDIIIYKDGELTESENFTTVSVGYQERLTFPDNGEYTIVVTVMGEIVFEEEVSIFAN